MYWSRLMRGNRLISTFSWGDACLFPIVFNFPWGVMVRCLTISSHQTGSGSKRHTKRPSCDWLLLWKSSFRLSSVGICINWWRTDVVKLTEKPFVLHGCFKKVTTDWSSSGSFLRSYCHNRIPKIRATDATQDYVIQTWETVDILDIDYWAGRSQIHPFKCHTEIRKSETSAD